MFWFVLAICTLVGGVLIVKTMWSKESSEVGSSISSGVGPSTSMAGDDPLAGFSRDEVNRAALEIVWPLPRCDKSVFGGTFERCDEAAAEVEAKRKKFADYQPLRLRKEIMAWLDYCDRTIEESRADIKSQKSKRNQDVYSLRSDQERGRTRELLGKLQINR